MSAFAMLLMVRSSSASWDRNVVRCSRFETSSPLVVDLRGGPVPTPINSFTWMISTPGIEEKLKYDSRTCLPGAGWPGSVAPGREGSPSTTRAEAARVRQTGLEAAPDRPLHLRFPEARSQRGPGQGGLDGRPVEVARGDQLPEAERGPVQG